MSAPVPTSDAEGPSAADVTEAGESATAGQLPGVFLMSNSLETGGSERQFAALAQSLDRSRFRVHLGCIMREGPFLTGLGDVPEFELGGSLYGLQSIRARLKLAQHLRQNEVALCHAFDFYTNLTLIPAARWARTPVVIGSQRQIGDLLTWGQERAQAAVLRWCDKVVCNSRAAAARLGKLGLRENQLTVIGNGLPSEAFAQTEPALPVVPGILRVGMIARMNTRIKNHQLFLKMAARLAPRFPNAEFVLVGDGPLRAELEREAGELGLRGRVLFLGDRRNVPAVLASLDVSVLPSTSESLSNVILESMAAGVPVAATLVGGNSELIADDRGLLVPPNDEEALAGAVERLLRDAEMRVTLGHNAQAFARESFTLKRMRERHEELYQELLDRKGWCKPELQIRRNAASNGGRKRIAIVAASPRYVGGQSVQADLLSRGWQNDRESELRFIAIDPEFPALFKWVEGIPLLRTIVRQPIYFLSLWRGFKDVDIAHIFSASYWSFLIAPAPAIFAAKLRGAKALVHYHSGEARDHLKRFPSARMVLRRADRLVVPSNHLVDVFREFGLEVRVIPNTVDLSQFSFRVRRPLRPHLICTRGFHPYYCVDVVIRAFAELQKVFPNARLDLVGSGPLEAEVRDLVNEKKLAGVDFKGVAPHERIAQLYNDADIFVNGSRLDNMPVSVLEAFASGLPVVSTEPEGMRFVVEDGRTGLLSPVGDAQALARNLMRVLEDANLAERLVSNARFAIARYSWPAVREQWLEVYREISSS